MVFQLFFSMSCKIEVLTSTYGRFYYNYSTDPESNTAMISGIVRFCKDGEIHNLP